MVSSIDLSTRLTATKLALKAIKEQEDATQSASNQRTQLLSSYGIDTSASTTTTLNNLLTRLSEQSGETTEADDSTPVSTDITSADFHDQPEEETSGAGGRNSDRRTGEGNAGGAGKGTLTVSDPLNGVQMTAWDPSDENDVTTQARTQIDSMGWSEFLKQRLEREGGSYVRSSTGAYTDATSGSNAFFGSVGDHYYYLTWPKADANTVTV